MPREWSWERTFLMFGSIIGPSCPIKIGISKATRSSHIFRRISFSERTFENNRVQIIFKPKVRHCERFWIFRIESKNWLCVTFYYFKSRFFGKSIFTICKYWNATFHFYNFRNCKYGLTDVFNVAESVHSTRNAKGLLTSLVCWPHEFLRRIF